MSRRTWPLACSTSTHVLPVPRTSASWPAAILGWLLAVENFACTNVRMIDADPANPCRSSGALAHTRVLIVDDEDDSRELLRSILEACGAEVLHAASVAAALEALEASHVDAIVSDIGMPERDGYGFIREVRSLPRRAAIPAIALTGLTSREDQARALGAGFDLHIGKPFDPTRLLEAVVKLVMRPRRPSGTVVG